MERNNFKKYKMTYYIEHVNGERTRNEYKELNFTILNPYIDEEAFAYEKIRQFEDIETAKGQKLTRIKLEITDLKTRRTKVIVFRKNKKIIED